jgi:hypothetical protein
VKGWDPTSSSHSVPNFSTNPSSKYLGSLDVVGIGGSRFIGSKLIMEDQDLTRKILGENEGRLSGLVGVRSLWL